MTTTTLPHSGFWRPTTRSAARSYVPSSQGIAKGAVPDEAFTLPQSPVLALPRSDIDELIAEFETTESGRTAISEGRQWVAETFYKEPSLAQLRLRKGLSQEQLAKLVKTTQPQIAKLESGNTADPRISTVTRLAEALGATVEEVSIAVANQQRLKY